MNDIAADYDPHHMFQMLQNWIPPVEDWNVAHYNDISDKVYEPKICEQPYAISTSIG
jgi:hypothetical protein